MHGVQEIKAVLLDLDDTLWPIAPVIQRAESLLHQWLAEHAPAVVAHYSIAQLRTHRSDLIATNPQFHYDLWALRRTSLQQVLEQFSLDPAKADQAMAVFSQARNQVTMYDDVALALPALAAHVTLGTISNGFADLAVVGIADHFKVSLAAHQFGCAKPDPSIFHAACAQLQLAPDQVAYVGDDLVLDVQGAQQAGLKGVWLNRHKILPEQSRSHIRPDAEIHTLQELATLFCRGKSF